MLVNAHLYVCGASGSGKGHGVNYDLCRGHVGKRAILYYAPRRDNGIAFLREISSSWPNVSVDDLSKTSPVLPLRTIPFGESPEENATIEDRMMEVFDAFTKGRIEDEPIKNRVCRDAIQAWQSMRLDEPACVLKYLFQPRHPTFDWLLDRIESDDVRARFEPYRQLHPSTLLQTVGSGGRIIERCFGNAAVVARDVGHGLNWEQIIDQKWIIITMGSPHVSLDAVKSVVKLRTAEIVHYLESSADYR